MEHYIPLYMPEDDEDYIELCDVSLVVQGRTMPVHSAFLGLHSKFFRKMLTDLKGSRARADEKLVITLDPCVSVDDAVLMLALVYGTRTEVKTVNEATRMLCMGDKFDIPLLLKAGSSRLCQEVDEMSFIKPRDAVNSSRDQDKEFTVTQLLTLTDRLGLKESKTLCQYVILRDIGVYASRDPDRNVAAMALKELEQVPRRSVAEICFAIMDLIHRGVIDGRNLGSLHCGGAQATAQQERLDPSSVNCQKLFGGPPAPTNSRGLFSFVQTRPCISCGCVGCVKKDICASLKKFNNDSRCSSTVRTE